MSKKVTKTTKATKVTKKATKAVAKKKAVKKPAKKVVAKRKTTKPATKKAVAKKKVSKKKPTMREKLQAQYKIVSNWSDSLMQDVYSVVYRTKTLKRFINENLANKYVEQEILLRLNEKAVATPAKIKGIKKELEAEFA